MFAKTIVAADFSMDQVQDEGMIQAAVLQCSKHTTIFIDPEAWSLFAEVVANSSSTFKKFLIENVSYFSFLEMETIYEHCHKEVYDNVRALFIDGTACTDQ